MILAQEWAASRHDSPAICVVTVDHGLRAEAADEAASVKAHAGRLGLPHEILHWSGPKPASSIQAAARAARYALMLAFCRDAGIPALATAHTADDQAETLLMRLARGSGLDGLAAIPPVSEREGVTLLRPLLDTSRARLEASLRERGVDWIEDPSNRDSAYERVRLREAMQAARALQLAPDRLALAAGRLHRARLALETVTAAFLDGALDVHAAGFGQIPLAALLAQPEDIGLRAIARMMGMFGGGARPVRLARIEALYAALRDAQDGRSAATLGGCAFTVRRGVLLIMREFGRIDAARLPLPGDRPLRWDGRFAVAAPGADGLTVGPLGPEGRAALRKLGGAIALPARIAYTLPAIRHGQDIVFTPFATFAADKPNGWIPDASAEFSCDISRK